MEVEIQKVLRITSGGFHSWVQTNVGIIKKPNNKIFFNTERKPKEVLEEKIEIGEKLNWWQKLLKFIFNIFNKF